VTGEFAPGLWAVILGGSSGFGLASARALAERGMNLCLVHRDRRALLAAIEPEFEKLRGTGVEVLSFNTDALSADKRDGVLEHEGQDFEPVTGIVPRNARGPRMSPVPGGWYGYQIGEDASLSGWRVVNAADGEAQLALDAHAVPRLRPGTDLEVERAVTETQEQARRLGMFQDL